MALRGISNANEFYSSHYLESVLTADIKKVRERWTEQAKAELEANPTAEISTPEQRFKALRKPWQKLREAVQGITGDPAERLRLQGELFFQPLLEALGYPYAPKAEPVLIGGEAYQVPLLGEVTNAKGEPWLWVVECFNPSDEPADPLELTIATCWGCQIDVPSLERIEVDADGHAVESWEELISERVFGQKSPPRWVLAVSRDQLLLIDRQKWAASRLLRFELDTLLGENSPDPLLAAATLLHCEHTCPSGGGTPLLDELDENSHKHAYEVSIDLKYALRRSIELLGNETIHWLKQQREGVFMGKTDAEQLTLVCLRYIYRLLFLFYLESRPDLGYPPMKSDVYRLGYSLESLRDLDTAELANEEEKHGFFISDSLDRLFQMIREGYPLREDPTAQLSLADAEVPFHDSFRLTPLRCHLFDPERMPTLTRARFRNAVLRDRPLHEAPPTGPSACLSQQDPQQVQQAGAAMPISTPGSAPRAGRAGRAAPEGHHLRERHRQHPQGRRAEHRTPEAHGHHRHHEIEARDGVKEAGHETVAGLGIGMGPERPDRVERQWIRFSSSRPLPSIPDLLP